MNYCRIYIKIIDEIKYDYIKYLKLITKIITITKLTIIILKIKIINLQ